MVIDQYNIFQGRIKREIEGTFIKKNVTLTKKVWTIFLKFHFPRIGDGIGKDNRLLSSSFVFAVPRM